MNASPDAKRASRSLSVLDRALYALFARHADSTRHDADRKRYQTTGPQYSRSPLT